MLLCLFSSEVNAFLNGLKVMKKRSHTKNGRFDIVV